MSHETLLKVEEDKNTTKDFGYWKLLVSNNTRTLGNCVLIVNRDVRRFSELTPEEVVNLGIAVKETENALQSAFQYDKINWLMLMMKDPQVHFHVIPRYKESKQFANTEFVDGLQEGDPLMYDKIDLSQEVLNLVRDELKSKIN